MSTVEKALEVLDLFSDSQPAIGLSEAARLLDRDKATMQRHLSALQAKGFLDQDPLTRAWHLGPAVTRLGMVRERTWPVQTSVRNILTKLVEDTGETCHASHFAAGVLNCVAVVETRIRGTRVFIDPAETLALHATASGLAFLSGCTNPADLIASSPEKFTANTPASRTVVMQLIDDARTRGWALALGTFETDVVGMAAPVYGPGSVVGAIAIATPLARFDESVEAGNGPLLIEAAAAVSRVYGAQPQMLRAAE